MIDNLLNEVAEFILPVPAQTQAEIFAVELLSCCKKPCVVDQAA